LTHRQGIARNRGIEPRKITVLEAATTHVVFRVGRACLWHRIIAR
jgi:hypothetical protein